MVTSFQESEDFDYSFMHPKLSAVTNAHATLFLDCHFPFWLEFVTCTMLKGGLIHPSHPIFFIAVLSCTIALQVAAWPENVFLNNLFQRLSCAVVPKKNPILTTVGFQYVKVDQCSPRQARVSIASLSTAGVGNHFVSWVDVQADGQEEDTTGGSSGGNAGGNSGPKVCTGTPGTWTQESCDAAVQEGCDSATCASFGDWTEEECKAEGGDFSVICSGTAVHNGAHCAATYDCNCFFPPKEVSVQCENGF